MTDKKNPADFSKTPGASDKASTDEPIKLGEPGPRDALTDPDPNDYVPDMEEKGYHSGLVRQPAAPLVEDGSMVGFESLGGESKFEAGSLAHLKSVHNAEEGEKTSTSVSPEPTAEEVNSSANAGKVAKA